MSIKERFQRRKDLLVRLGMEEREDRMVLPHSDFEEYKAILEYMSDSRFKRFTEETHKEKERCRKNRRNITRASQTGI